jgi:flagellar biosynthetic protein FliP
MRTDALVIQRLKGFFARRACVLLALCVLSASSVAAAQQKSAAASASPTTDTEVPLLLNAATDRGPATDLDSLPGPTVPATAPASIGGYRVPDLTDRQNFSAALQLIILLTVLSLAPAILIMMTCFTRIIIVLSLLRQALGTQQLPPNQVLIGLAMFMTFLVMGPTWRRVNNEALRPYLDGSMDPPAALAAAEVPVREFMIVQIEKAGNAQDVLLFHQFSGEKSVPEHWSDVGTMTLIPGFMLSELKTAFLMGFKIYLPFLIIDIVISTILISMGMMMLPPVMISLPFKLLLFVLVDGWHLITKGLMGSFGVT